MDLLMNPEAQLISRILYCPREFDDLEVGGFDPDILSLPYATAFKEIARIRFAHGDTPSAKHLLKISPNIQIMKSKPAKKATLYWEQIYRRRWRAELLGSLLKIKSAMPDDIPDEALQLPAITEGAAELMAGLGSKYSFDAGRPALLGEMMGTLRKEYAALEKGESIGVQIPFEFLQVELVGWKKGRIYIVAGRPKTGKSWFALICAAHAVVTKTKVLFVSLEMTQEELSKRMACLFGSISYNRVVKGKLEAKEKKEYFAWLDKLEKDDLGRFIKIVGPGQAKTPETIAALAKGFGAGMVVVDAFYHGVIEGTGEKGWEQIRELMRRYRKVSLQSSSTWMLTTQFNRQQRGRGSAHLGNLAFGDAIGMDANGMIYLVRDAYLKKARQVDIILGEAREADDVRAFRYNWNFITMDFSKVGAVEYGADDSSPFG